MAPTTNPLDTYKPDFAGAYELYGIEGVETLARSLREANGAPTSTRRLYTFPQLADFPPTSWLIDGELPAHALALLYGPSGCGKSFFSVDVAMTIARQTQRPVIYVAAEGVSGYHDRATAWCKHHKYSGANLYFDIQPLTLRDADALQVFIDTIKPMKPALVVIDTLARCMLGLDENSARDMGIAVEACATIIRETGAAVMLVHHTGKSGIGERGSSALYAACDSVIALSNEDGLITVACAKTKDGKPFADRYLRMVEVATADGRSSCVVLPSDRVITKGAPLTSVQKKTLELLAQETFIIVGAQAKSLMNQLGVSERSIYRTLSNLMRDGYVRQASKGDPYFIQDKGLEAIELPPLPNTANVSHVSPTNPLTATATTLEGGSTVSSGSSANGQEEQEQNPLPYLDSILEPKHSRNGNGRHS